MQKLFLAYVRFVNNRLSGNLSKQKMTEMADTIADIFVAAGFEASSFQQADRLTSEIDSLQQLPDTASELWSPEKGDAVAFWPEVTNGAFL
jgi:hypothetical protein